MFDLKFILNQELFETNGDNNEELINIKNNELICYVRDKCLDQLLESNDSVIGCIVCRPDPKADTNLHSNALFVCIKSLKCDQSVDPLVDQRVNSLQLIVSQTFLTHYSLSLNQNHLCLKIITKCPKITKLTIAVKDNSLYESIKSDVWSQSLLHLVSEEGVQILCRKNDIFCGNNDLIVMNCEPILQGVIGVNTEVLVVNVSQTMNQTDTSEPLTSEQTSGQESDNKIVRALNLMNFTTRLLLKPTLSNTFDDFSSNSGHNSMNAIQTLTASTTFLNSMSFSFQIIILSKNPLIDEIDCENGCVFLSRNALTNKLKSEPKDWVRIWLSSNDISLTQKQRFSQIYAIDSITDDNIAYISPQLWFNLQTLSNDFTNKPLIQPNVTLMIRKDILLKDHIKYSPEIQISLVQSPEYSANHDFSILLKCYFDKRRYVKKNDVIGIWSRDDLLYHTKSKSLSYNEWPVIYFRVNALEGNGCLIDSSHSNLYQTGSVHSLIPATLASYYRTHLIQYEDNPNPLGLESYVQRLSELVVPYLMPKRTSIATIMIEGPIGSGKKTIVRAICKNWNLHLYHINTNDLLGDSAVQTETKIKTSLLKAVFYAPTVILISNINILSNNELYDDSRIAKTFSQTLFEMNDTNSDYPIIIIATNSEPKLFANNELNSLFIHSLEIDGLDIEERQCIIRALLGQLPASDVNFKELAQKSAAFYLSDFKALVLNALKYAFESLISKNNDDLETSDLTLAGVVVTNEYLMRALNDLQKMHFESMGSPNIPNVKWDDIGGHEAIKSEILDTIQLPLECPQLASLGFKRSGVLLYGPPGTGKTLLAKAAATQCSLNFLSVKGPELINMFVGQSEENVRNIFSRARKCAPSVIFFDELDSLAPNRGHSGDSGGVMDRVVSQLLAEMDGINKSNQVFVIGATNRLDLLDSALLRPGRFDRLLYVGIANDSESRLKILKALTRKFQFDNDIDLQHIESLCRPGLSGADLYSICSDALMKAIERSIGQLNDNTVTEEEMSQIVVQMSDFMSALHKIPQN